MRNIESVPVTPADVWILVLNWNRREETLACLETLVPVAAKGAHLLLVDNGSRDGSVAAVAERYPGVTVLPLPRNEGYAGGNNAGIRLALERGARAVLLLNNDTAVAPDFLEPLLWALNDDPRVAAVSSAILRFDRPEVLDLAYLELYFGHGIVRRHGVNAMPGEGFDERKAVDAGSGCSLLLSAEALRQVGLFDEAYFAYHEEVDWCFRARQAGYRIMYQPLSRVWHHGSRSTEPPPPSHTAPRTDDGPQLANPMPLPWNPVRVYLGARNTVRFMRAHGTAAQKRFFVQTSARALVLETLAVVLDREGEFKIGALTIRRALDLLADRHLNGAPPPARRSLRRLRRAVALSTALAVLPRDLWRVHRAGRTKQVIECMRGLRDGVLGRRLPLERLGLR
jgi:GT2 family glycosyltransferase